MRTKVVALLQTEAKQFSLRFACTDCAHFDAEHDACVHGYPADEGPRDEQLYGDSLAFCKEFELGGA